MRPNFGGELSPLPQMAYAMPSIPQDIACYRILKPCFLDDTYCTEGEIVTWDREPNKEMEPLNDMAKVMTMEFFDKIDKCGREASALRGTKYIPMRRPVEEDISLNTAASRRVEIVKGDGGIPVMGAKKKPGRPSLQKVTVGAHREQGIRTLAKDANAAKDE